MRIPNYPSDKGSHYKLFLLTRVTSVYYFQFTSVTTITFSYELELPV